MRLLSIFMLTLLVNLLNAQDKTKNWYRAELELMDGTKLSGEANYNIREQNVQLKAEGRTLTYGEREIVKMTLATDSTRHDFLLIALKGDDNRVILVLGELLYQSDSNLSLFRRHMAAKSEFTSPGPLASYTRQIPAHLDKDSFQSGDNIWSRRYSFKFLADYDGNIFDATRKGVSEAYKPWAKKIRKYANSRGLRFSKEEHMIEILKYCDSLLSKN